ncbi:MAG: hypothetical protein MAG715_01212 [Methanonatronarchaeales archaeon]|nr:hypothetical protein [Methanonatronarchaeales archaeon]MBS1264017.1 hypothetical protein [Methanonatronarchaeales archaeon]
MPRIRIEYDRETCIGAFVCVDQDPDHFEPDNGKAVLVGGKRDDGVYVLENDVDGDGMERAVMAAKGCPVDAINVRDVDSGEDLYWGFEH